MSRSTRLTRLFIVTTIALALSIPALLPSQQAHATNNAHPAHGNTSLHIKQSARHTVASRLTSLLAVQPAVQLAAQPDLSSLATTVPVTIQVPAGNVAYLQAHATGVQIYTCTSSSSTFVWSSSVPAATLFNAAGHQIATHYAGPTWQANDGSTVVGHKLAAVTVAPDSIPWLLLNAVSTTLGSGGGNTLSDTSYIQRLQTRGGLTPPASGCTAGTVGTVVSVPYTAIYVFWQAVPFVTSAPGAVVGHSLTVTGTNFQAGESVQVSWDYTGTTPVASGTASISGTIVASFTVPAGLAGAHTLLARGQSSGTTDFAYVQVRPRLVVTPTRGAVGSQVVASGDGFGATETVILTWDSPTGAMLGSTSSDALGSFGSSTAVAFTVPSGASTGFHRVYATGQTSGVVAVAGFGVH